MDEIDERVVEFVRLVFKALSDNPNDVEVLLEDNEGIKVLNIKADPSDYSKFIGKDGVVINSVRKLMFSIAADRKCRWIINIPKD